MKPTIPIDAETVRYFTGRLQRLRQIEAILDEDKRSMGPLLVSRVGDILNEKLRKQIHEERQHALLRLDDYEMIEVKEP